MKHFRSQDARNRFEKRLMNRAIGSYELVSNQDESILAVTSKLEAMENEFEISPRLMITLSLKKAGRLLRTGDWGKVDGILEPGTIALALPYTKAEGFSPEAEMLGIAIDAEKVEAILADSGGIDALHPAASSLTKDSLIESVMIALWRDAQTHGLSSAFFDQGIDLILKRLTKVEVQEKSFRSVGRFSEGQLQRALDLIESRIGMDLSVDEIARELDRDPRSVTRAFKAATGYAPYEYLTHRRMERAKQLLSGRLTILEIALDVGYTNPSKFAAAFRKFNGCSPSEWRRRLS